MLCHRDPWGFIGGAHVVLRACTAANTLTVSRLVPERGCTKSGISPSLVGACASIYGVRSSRWSREEPDVMALRAGSASKSGVQKWFVSHQKRVPGELPHREDLATPLYPQKYLTTRLYRGSGYTMLWAGKELAYPLVSGRSSWFFQQQRC
jgi:hypothetical protein